jgi:hypothetical protein
MKLFPREPWGFWQNFLAVLFLSLGFDVTRHLVTGGPIVHYPEEPLSYLAWLLARAIEAIPSALFFRYLFPPLFRKSMSLVTRDRAS